MHFPEIVSYLLEFVIHSLKVLAPALQEMDVAPEVMLGVTKCYIIVL